MVHWLVIDTGRPEDVKRVADAVEAEGHPCRTVSLKDVYENPDNKLWSEDDVVVHGPVKPTDYLCKTRGWLAWLDLNQTTCRKYYSYFGQWLLQDKYVMLPIGDLRRQWDFLYKLFGEDEHLFVRPDENDKMFTAKCIDRREVSHFERAGLAPETLVVVSRPRRIAAEYRIFMHRGVYLTGSLYKVDGQLMKLPDVPKEIQVFAELAATHRYRELPPVWIMDVCEIVDKQKYRIVEVSGSSCAGFYESDHAKIVQATSIEAELFFTGRKQAV